MKCSSIIFSLLLLVEFNCVPSSYQSPRPLRQGEMAVGGGFSLPITKGDLSLCFRYGVFKHADFGFKLGGYPDISYGYFLDARYGLLEHPLLLSGGLGFLTYFDLYAPDYELRVHGFHPTIFLGTDRIYGGIGWNYMIVRETRYPMDKGPYISTSRSSGPRIILGASWGKRWKFNPEINVNFQRDDRSLAPIIVGFGIHRVFFKKN